MEFSMLSRWLPLSVSVTKSLSPFRRESLHLEGLEDRVEPATLFWTGDVDANWSTNVAGNTNWSSDLLPSNGDDLIFPIVGFNRANNNDFNHLILNTLTFSGTNYTIGGNPLTLSSLVNESLPGTNTLSAPLDLSTDLPISVPIFDSRLILSGIISGPGGFVKDGRGILSLTGTVPNTYTGTTRVTLGILEMDSNTFDGPLSNSLVIGDSSHASKSAVVRLRHFNQIPNECAVTIRSDGWLDTNGFVEGIGSLTMDGGAVITTGNGSLNVSRDVAVTGAGPAIPATISGFLSLSNLDICTFTVADGPADIDLQIGASIFLGGIIKNGPGKMVLNGANTFDGSTTVQVGTLEINGRVTFFNPVYVTGGFLIGNGSLGTLTGTGGVISPGAFGASGVLTTNHLTLGTATFAADIFGRATFDQLKVVGSIDLNGGTLQTNLAFGSAVGNAFRIIDNDGTADAVLGTFNGLPEGQRFNANGRSLSISYVGGDGNDVVLRDVGTAIGKPELVGAKQFAVGSDVLVDVFNPDGSFRFRRTPFIEFFSPPFAGGVRTAAADFTGDGVADIVVGTGPGRPSHVKILDGVTADVLFTIDPFEASFPGGVYVAAGDLNGDGRADLAITPDEGGGPRVRVFDGNGFGQLSDFFGIDDPNFRGGARTALGDLNGDGRADLVVAAGFGGGPRVAAFDGARIGVNGGPKLFGDFFAFESSLRNGIFIAAGDVNGDGFADVVAGGGPGSGPRVYTLDGKSLTQNGSNTLVPIANYFAGDPESRGGVRVAVKDLDGDAKADVVTGSGANAGSRVSAYLGADTTLGGGTPPTTLNFDAFASFTGGLFVGY